MSAPRWYLSSWYPSLSGTLLGAPEQSAPAGTLPKAGGSIAFIQDPAAPETPPGAAADGGFDFSGSADVTALIPEHHPITGLLDGLRLNSLSCSGKIVDRGGDRPPSIRLDCPTLAKATTLGPFGVATSLAIVAGPGAAAADPPEAVAYLEVGVNLTIGSARLPMKAAFTGAAPSLLFRAELDSLYSVGVGDFEKAFVPSGLSALAPAAM